MKLTTYEMVVEILKRSEHRPFEFLYARQLKQLIDIAQLELFKRRFRVTTVKVKRERKNHVSA